MCIRDRIEVLDCKKINVADKIMFLHKVKVIKGYINADEVFNKNIDPVQKTEEINIPQAGMRIDRDLYKSLKQNIEFPRIISHLAFGFLILFIGLNYNFSLEQDFNLKPGEKKNEAILIDDIIEKPSIEDAPSDIAVCGRYILTATIFEHLKKIESDKSGEIQLTDAIKSLLSEEKVFAKI